MALNLPKEAIIGLVGGLLVLLVLAHVILQAFIFLRFAQQASIKQKMDKIQTDKTNVDRVVTRLRALQAKVQSIENLTVSQRILWSQKLNDLSDSIPRGIWLTKMSLEARVLLIEGSAVSKNQNEMISPNNFVSLLKAQERFVADLSTLEVGVVQRRKVLSTEVADFSITAKLK